MKERTVRSVCSQVSRLCEYARRISRNLGNESTQLALCAFEEGSVILMTAQFILFRTKDPLISQRNVRVFGAFDGATIPTSNHLLITFPSLAFYHDLCHITDSFATSSAANTRGEGPNCPTTYDRITSGATRRPHGREQRESGVKLLLPLLLPPAFLARRRSLFPSSVRSFHLIVAVIKVTSHLPPRSIKSEHDDRIFQSRLQAFLSTLVQTAGSDDSL